MTDVAVRPAERLPEPVDKAGGRPGRGDRIFRVVLGLVVMAAVVLRFTANQALWLDEAQSVAIARLPFSGDEPTLFTGLEEDGSPPLYYLVLHGWISLFGTGNMAVRTLSALLNLLAAWPLFALAKKIVGTRAAQVTVVLYLTSPFALYFATETRMYSLIVLLTALGGLALERALRSPSVVSAVLVALAAGCLALTHYWTFYLLLTVSGWLILLAWRPRFLFRGDRASVGRPGGGPPLPGSPGRAGGPSLDPEAREATLAAQRAAGLPETGELPPSPQPRQRGAHSAAGAAARVSAATTRPRFPAGGRKGVITALVGIIGGAIVFSPWLPTFLSQMGHTGTPWGEPATFAAVSHAYGQWAGGPTTLGRILLLFITCLAALGIAGRGLGGRFVLIDPRGLEPGRTLFLLATVTLVVAVAAGKVVGNAWADRYTSTAFVPFLLVIGLGATIVRHERMFRCTVVVCALAGVIAGAGDIHRARTQASEAAAVLGQLAKPGDVLLICPDQLGPGLARTLPAGLRAHLIPDWQPPDRVNWVDYEERNAAADGTELARRAIQEAGANTIFLATAGGYRTYETLCLQIQTELQRYQEAQFAQGQRGRPDASPIMAQAKPADVYENYYLVRFPGK
ncbi:MAG: glycosyltransferase family 39 protein [Frankia sp.]|nr:glycosyltransferase family 39 protein [Frankia sp.]